MAAGHGLARRARRAWPQATAWQGPGAACGRRASAGAMACARYKDGSLAAKPLVYVYICTSSIVWWKLIVVVIMAAGLQCAGVSVSKRQLLHDERDSGSYPWSVGRCVFVFGAARPQQLLPVPASLLTAAAAVHDSAASRRPAVLLVRRCASRRRRRSGRTDGR